MPNPEPGLEDLYRDLILDHYRRPRNKGVAEGAQIDLHQNNPLCGDEIRLTIRLRDGRIEDVEFLGQGCSISQSSASMMTERIKGLPVQEADKLAAAFRQMMRGGEADENRLGELMALQGVSRYPVRIKCAVLAWDTLQKGLERHD
ncbi:MAG: SUF system NifU family Fe-S cluster assembly protein [Chloroflexi bacterium]|nr:SUF system NifU family Fe-S cluster assembly protein [Chloroflexota bacterium]